MSLRLRLPEDLRTARPGDLGHISVTGHDPHTFYGCGLRAGSKGIGEHGTRQKAPFVRLQKCG
jgi:hypothetical protein